VQEALSSGVWVNDIKRDLSDHAVFQCLCIWVLVQQVQLVPGVPDQHIWTPSSSSKYSTKSAYDRFFTGAVGFEPADRIWKTWAPPKCKFFLLLAVINRCRMADRLARRGLDHPDKCPLCDQEDETVQHILVSCVFARIVPAALVTKPWRGDISGLVEVGREEGVSSHEEGLQHFGCSCGMVDLETSKQLCVRRSLSKCCKNRAEYQK
jgi:hypothetical protein